MNGRIVKTSLSFTMEKGIEVAYLEIPIKSKLLKIINEDNHLYFYVLLSNFKTKELMKIIAYKDNYKYNFEGEYINTITLSYHFKDITYHFFVINNKKVRKRLIKEESMDKIILHSLPH